MTSTTTTAEQAHQVEGVGPDSQASIREAVRQCPESLQLPDAERDGIGSLTLAAPERLALHPRSGHLTNEVSGDGRSPVRVEPCNPSQVVIHVTDENQGAIPWRISRAYESCAARSCSRRRVGRCGVSLCESYGRPSPICDSRLCGAVPLFAQPCLSRSGRQRLCAQPWVRAWRRPGPPPNRKLPRPGVARSNRAAHHPFPELSPEAAPVHTGVVP